MSYDEKIKDLMARLVSMSPEPPSYPEGETPLARHETRKNRRPVLVFAGAVAVVALLALPLLLFTGARDPVAVPSSTTTTTVPSSTTTSPGSTTSSTAVSTTTSPTAPQASPWVGTVFLYQTPEASSLGNPALVPVSGVFSGGVTGDDELTDVLAAIGSGMPELSDPLSNAVPADVRIVSQSTTDAGGGFVVTLDMNEAFLGGAGGLLADVTMLNQLIYSATEPFGEGTSVVFTVNGEPIEAFGAEGLVLTEPVTRETYIDSLAPIFLTAPIMETEHVWVVTGRANTFEAALTVRVLDGERNLVHEEPVMATCGSGCWGEFGVGIDSDLIIPGESFVQVLTFSPENGEPTNVLTVPIPADGAWQMTVGN